MFTKKEKFGIKLALGELQVHKVSFRNLGERRKGKTECTRQTKQKLYFWSLQKRKRPQSEEELRDVPITGQRQGSRMQESGLKESLLCRNPWSPKGRLEGVADAGRGPSRVH